RLVSGGTDNHLMLLDLRPAYPDVSGRQAEEWLGMAGIVVNKNMIPFDERKPMQTSGLRLGTPALTTRGMKEAEMTVIAGLIDRVIRAQGHSATIADAKGEVLSLCEQFSV
ncbi:MAG: serine hydroxymethyltransferase, partial [Planctomycetes bacterium]|nr:serine hydroxymethyltransferase [Planctomycetota bacterium]